MRTNLANDIAGGLSAIMRACLNLFFDDRTHDSSVAGILLDIKSCSSMRLFLQLGAFIADEAAIHYALKCKGASGLKPCFLCANVYNEKTVRGCVEADGTGWAVYHTCTDHTKLQLHTTATIAAVLDRLQGAIGHMNQGDLSELETRLGWSHEPNGLLHHPRWKELWSPTEVVMYDWMHVYFVGGIFNIQVGHLLHVLKEFRITQQVLEQYCSEFRWPSSVLSKCADLFSKKRYQTSWQEWSLKGTASECLSLVPVLATYMEDILEQDRDPTLKAHAACYLQLATCIELIGRTAKHAVEPSTLQRAICSHLGAFRDLYGAENMVLKFHYAMHMPLFLQRYGWLPNCFVLERKHKTPKRFGNHLSNTSKGWETSVLRDCTAHQMAKLEEHHFSTVAELVRPKVANKHLRELLQQIFRGAEGECKMAKTARINAWETVSKGDLVRIKGIEGDIVVGQVEWHGSMEVFGELHCISGYRLLRFVSDARRHQHWAFTETQAACLTEAIEGSLVWVGSADDVIVLKHMR